MQVVITSRSKTELGFYFTATCGKTSAFVGITCLGVRVTCQNASHKVWRGAGRFFPTLEEAIKGYKKTEMRAIIEAAADSSKA